MTGAHKARGTGGRLLNSLTDGARPASPDRGPSRLWRYSLALGATVAAWLLRLALQPILEQRQLYPTFYLALILVNWWCGLGPSLLTLFLGALLAQWCLPHLAWPSALERGMGLASYLLVGLVIVWSGWANRRARDACGRELLQRQQAEAAARQSERRLAMVAAATFEGVAIIENGRFIDANEQLGALLGCPRQDILGRPVADFIAPEDRQTVLDLISSGLETRTERTMLRKDGSRFIAEAHGKSAQFDGRFVRCTALRDITQRRQAEESLRQAKELLAAHNVRLEEAVQERTAHLQETIAELHRFSYALAHNLRAPLRATNGYLALIARHTQDSLSPTSREWFRRAQLATEHLDLLITDALDYSKAVLQELPLEPVELRALLAGLLQTHPNLQAHEQHIHIPCPLPTVLGNRSALMQCFANLLDNALKFCRPGVTPHVAIWAEERPGPAACSQPLSAAPAHPLAAFAHNLSDPAPPPPPHRGLPNQDPPAPFVRIWVEDNGIGVPQEAQARLFTMFERLNPEFEGTGIGLAIVRKEVQRMGGEVGLESAAGQGSRFWLEVRRA